MRLRKERKAAGLTQADLARMADVTQGYISKLERGDRVTPRFDILDRIARALRRFGRHVEVGQIAPRPQPLLIKGARAQRKRSA
jgi:transcriptional regulator with XRE-family HTH domain